MGAGKQLPPVVIPRPPLHHYPIRFDPLERVIRLAYEDEKRWVKEKIKAGAKIDKKASHYQTLKRAEKNLPEIQAFMEANDVDSRTY